MAMEKLCMRVGAERVWSQEGRWYGWRSNDDQVINKKHSALCRHKARVSISAQGCAHRVRAPSSAEGCSFCPPSCTISPRTSRKRSGSRWTLGEVTRDRTPSGWLWSHSERRPCKVAATGPLTTISSTPLTLAISPILPLCLHQHYTLHTELLNCTATLRCFLVYSLSLCVFFFFLLQGSNLPSVAACCLMKVHHLQVQAGFTSIMCFRGQERRSLLWPSKGRHL